MCIISTVYVQKELQYKILIVLPAKCSRWEQSFLKNWRKEGSLISKKTDCKEDTEKIMHNIYILKKT